MGLNKSIMTLDDKEKAIKKELIGIIFVMLKLRQETDFLKRLQLRFLGLTMGNQIKIIQSQPTPRFEKGSVKIKSNPSG